MKNGWMGRMAPGIILIAIGVLFLLSRVGVPVPNIGSLIADYWPVILIVIGLKGALGRNRRSGWIWGLALALVGVVLLNNNVEWLPEFNLGDIVKFALPIILIIMGVRMLFGRHAARNQPPNPPVGGQRDLNFGSGAPDMPDTPVWPPTPPGMGSGSEQVPPPPPPPGPSILDERFPVGEPDAPRERQAAHPNGTLQQEWGRHPHGDRGMPHGPAGSMPPPWSEPVDPREARRQAEQQRKEARREWQRQQREHRRQHRYWNGETQWGQYCDYRGGVEHRSSFIGDIRMGQSYWDLKPLNISHFIGDTELDLTRAHIPDGETRIQVSSFIGDVKVYIPDDPEIEVVVKASSFIGDVTLPDAGTRVPRDCDKKVTLDINLFIGDVKVKRLL